MSWVLLQTKCHPCVSGCGRCLALGVGPDRCLTCLGSKHAEVVLWMSHLLTVDAHLGVAARLIYLDKGAQLLPPPVHRLQRPACSSPWAAPCIHPRTTSTAAFKSGAVELGVGRPLRTFWPPSTGGKRRERELLR